jgi:hypothetical protein
MRVVGSVTAVDGDDTRLNFVVDTDTLPANTLPDVDRIINPQTSLPGGILPAASVGQRYLTTEPITDVFVEWGVDAPAGSILEYTGLEWSVVFSGGTSAEWVTNSASGEQYLWTGSEWVSSWQGEYVAGYWRLLL